ncbi:uncharacterized protein LOC128389455 [Panonychus citri]|uniref:uncharacterized protein LOC128389455 n=1 Tax=Panonychus citri TaxID=50023 RepID=UPI0023080CEA|nr:uncharacterized protein LOC128389455 [Panonychus citri]
MMRVILLACLIVTQVSCYPRHEDDEARVLSEVWEAMDKHRGDDIIVIPRHDGPGSGPEHHDSSDHGSSDHHDSSSSHDGPSSHEDSSSRGESSDRSESERKSSETESTSESSGKSESSDVSASESSSSSSESSERSSDNSPRRGRSHEESESSYDQIWNKFNRIGDMMNRAVERLRKDDREIEELENGSSSSSGLTVFIFEIVGAVVVGLILVGLLIFGFVKGLKGFKVWKARRQSERLVDQEAPNMDGTGYQSGYNP